MLTPLTRKHLPLLAWLGVAVSAVLLTACGGGGGGSTPSSSGGSSGGSGSSSGTPVTGAVTLSGVVAMGAPLIGATVTVVDANGASCGTTTTALADGTYTLPLTCSSFTLPLLIEAAGPDMSGAPQVLHSVMQGVTTGSSTVTSAHVNPLTNAVVAMLMGGDPTPHFQNGKAAVTGSAAVRSAHWSLLGSATALRVASDVLKTAIRPNLNDAGLTNAALVDFFSDTNTILFSPNKTGLDATLEGLRIQFGRNSSADETLQLSNRFLQACNPSSACSAVSNLGSPEVVMNLTTAYNSLNVSTPTTAATTAAITTTVKVTTSTSALMSPIAQLETLRGAINGNIRPPALATDLATLEYSSGKPVFASTFVQQDGASALSVATTLIGYGALDYQLSSFMVLGCMDYPIVTRCTKVRLAAMVRSQAGVQDLFEITANYVAATSSWSFVGNGRQSSWRINPVSWRYLNGDGSALASSATGPNPGQGVQTFIQSVDPVSPLIADVVMNTGAVRLYNCNASPGDAMCLSHHTVSGQEAGYETGDLVLDQILPTTNVSWLGPTDTRPGTRFQMTATGIGVNETSSLILQSDLPSTSTTGLYPLPDGLSGSAPLLHGAVEAGLTISWNTWAAANPGLRMVEVRAVITRPPFTAPAKQVFSIKPLAATQLTIPAFSSVPSDAVEHSLWLIAQDGLGRRYITKIVAL